MELRKYILKLIRERIEEVVSEENIDEPVEFDSQSAYMTAISMSLNKRNWEGKPRFGIDNQINNYNQVLSQRKQDEFRNGESHPFDNNFREPSPNTHTAPTLTNMYQETYNMYGSTKAAQDNLDKETLTPNTGTISDETQEIVDTFNDNINITLNRVKYPSDDTGGMKPPINKGGNF